MNRNILRLYFIMGTANVKKKPLYVLEEALKGGITAFQFREKGPDALKGYDYVRFAKECQQLCKAYGVPFIVNDDIELAVQLDADGVHIGQDDGAIDIVRQAIGNKYLGVSVHNMEEAEQAIKSGTDYVGIGPIYATQSKADAKKPSGTTFLKEAASRYPSLPIVGIGGITVENGNEVLSAGADGISVISAISLSDNPFEATQKLKFVDTPLILYNRK